MPRQAFEVIVTVSGAVATEESAIAEASRYLAYADHSDTFGNHSEVFDVNVYGGDLSTRNGDWGIALSFTAMIENDRALKRFMDRLADLSRVETVENIPYGGKSA